MSQITRQSVIWAIEELASLEMQERLWLSNGSSGEVSSFEEAVCNVFDAVVTSELESGGIADPVNTLLLRLRAVIREIDVNLPPKVIIDSPQMDAVRCIASELLNVLNQECAPPVTKVSVKPEPR